MNNRMNTVIASTSLFGQRPGEERFEIAVEVGTPYQCGNDPEEWACPVAVRPLSEKLRDVHANDSLQALCLAIALVQDWLQDFREKGGVLTFDTGEEFPLEAYSFGIASSRRSYV